MPAGLYRLRDNHPNYPQDHVAWISTYSELSGALSSETHRSHPHPQPSLRMDHSHDAPTTLDQAAAQDGIQDFRHAGNWTSRPIDVTPEYMVCWGPKFFEIPFLTPIRNRATPIICHMESSLHLAMIHPLRLVGSPNLPRPSRRLYLCSNRFLLLHID